MKLVVGLGNPGKDFEGTYHNLGFLALDKVANLFNVKFDKIKGQSLFTFAKFEKQKVLLLKPLTFMNLSGQAVSFFTKFYKLQIKDIIVLCDDVDLKKGKVRFRQSGTGGTHNGLKNIIHCLSSKDFARIKIGAGSENIVDLKDYVLSKIDKESLEIINPSIDEAARKVLMWLRQ